MLGLAAKEEKQGGKVILHYFGSPVLYKKRFELSGGYEWNCDVCETLSNNSDSSKQWQEVVRIELY